MAEVFLKKTEYVARTVREWGDLFSEVVRPGDRVLIKPNLGGGNEPRTGMTAHPEVIEEVVAMVVDTGAGDVAIAEDPSSRRPASEVFEDFDLYGIARRFGARVVDLSECGYEAVDPPGGLVEGLEISREVLACDRLIGVTTLKTHHQCRLTGALKNMFSNVPSGLRREFHRRDLEKAIVAINSVRSPDLTIVDGAVGAEGMAPVEKRPVEMGVALAGRDPVAVDTVMALLMGFDPRKVRTLFFAGRAGLGTCRPEEISVIGDPLEVCSRRFMDPIESMAEHLKGHVEVEKDVRETGYSGIVATALGYIAFREKGGERLSGLRIAAGDHPGYRLEGRTVSVGDFRFEMEGGPFWSVPQVVELLREVMR